jgi:PAS domain S-box-containing protein
VDRLQKAQPEVSDAPTRSAFESDSWFRRIADTAKDLVYVYRLEPPGYLYVSPSVTRITGYTPEDAYNDPAFALRVTHPDDRPMLESSVTNLEAPQRIELRCFHRDGTLRWLEQENTPVRDGSGRVVALYGIAREITGRKQAEEERAQLQRRLAQAEKLESVGRLAGAVAHDFNNLLTVIAGYAMLTQEDELVPENARHKLSEIVLASNRAKDLTQKLLVMSSRQPSEPRVIAVDEFVRQEASLLPHVIGQQIVVQVETNAAGAHVRIDPAQLSATLTNLILNARDAMPDGGRLGISTAVEPEAEQALRGATGPFVRLSIADTGIGMDDAVQAHLFEPFFTTKRAAGASGLGLATVYGHVQQAGGFVDVHTAPQRGTTVSVWLPLSSESEPRRAIRHTGVQPRGTESLLVVEDEPAVRALAVAILSRLGYQVTSAPGPAEALQIAAQSAPFDLVVSDVVMPGMDGRQMIERLRRIAPGFDVLYVSGYADHAAANTEAVYADPEHFLAKPYTPAALAHKVRDLLDRRAR